MCKNLVCIHHFLVSRNMSIFTWNKKNYRILTIDPNKVWANLKLESFSLYSSYDQFVKYDFLCNWSWEHFIFVDVEIFKIIIGKQYSPCSFNSTVWTIYIYARCLYIQNALILCELRPICAVFPLKATAHYAGKPASDWLGAGQQFFSFGHAWVWESGNSSTPDDCSFHMFLLTRQTRPKDSFGSDSSTYSVTESAPLATSISSSIYMTPSNLGFYHTPKSGDIVGQNRAVTERVTYWRLFQNIKGGGCFEAFGPKTEFEIYRR